MLTFKVYTPRVSIDDSSLFCVGFTQPLRSGPGFGLETVTCTASMCLNMVVGPMMRDLRGSLHHLTKTKSIQFYCTFHVSRLEDPYCLSLPI